MREMLLLDKEREKREAETQGAMYPATRVRGQRNTPGQLS